MKAIIKFSALLLAVFCVRVPLLSQNEKTVFQTGTYWRPQLNVDAQAAIVYGTHPLENCTFEERVASWRERGYTTYFMTGIAWGEYQEYFTGKWDGRRHDDEGQMRKNGEVIWHGKDVPYVVPTMNFLAYMKERQIKRAIDAGIDYIFLEEPEFWAFAGYSEAFKREWKAFYGFDWRPQDASAENLYLSNKLKYHLYYRALRECFTYAKEYGKSLGRTIYCFVPTHSLVNYSQWRIVSPEASLALMDCMDGYIAQVWTGTSREPNYYQGNYRERVFETAFLEYGSMHSMTAPTNRKVFFLTDPIEDRPRDWDDYIRNYRATYIAQMLYPRNNNYEIMPWPERIYEGLYQVSSRDETKIRIPRSLSTQMHIMINASNRMPCTENQLSGTKGIGVLMANTLMFQRNDQPVDGYDDPQLSNFYGLAMPFVKRGVPVELVQIENTAEKNTWKDVKVLLMTYSNMKPMDEDMNRNIAAWVKSGGYLVYVSRDTDPFQSVQEWWNQDGEKFNAPSEHLFDLLGMPRVAGEGLYTCGKGSVYVFRKDPKEFVMQPEGERALVDVVSGLYKDKTGGAPDFRNYFFLERGPYTIVSVMDESVSSETLRLDGFYIDLFDKELPVVREKVVSPGEQAFLYDLKKIEKKRSEPQILVSAGKVTEEKVTADKYSFTVKAPEETTNVMRILLTAKPERVVVDTNSDVSQSWDEESKTLFLSFENKADGVSVHIIR